MTEHFIICDTLRLITELAGEIPHPAVYLSSSISRVWHSPEDDQSLLIETSSCTPSSFLELITTQLRFHMVSPQLVLLTSS